MKKAAFTLLLLLPFLLMSQTPLIEPSWELSLGEQNNEIKQQPTGFVETNDGCYIVCVEDLKNNFEEVWSDNSRIMKIDSDGELLHEIILSYDEGFNLQYTMLDIWNDTVNIFVLLLDSNNGDAVIMHTYLFDDLSVSEHNEIKRIEFAEFDEQHVEYNVFTRLIDDNGCRTFYIELSTERLRDRFVKILKFDAKLDLITESDTYNQEDDLNSFMYYSYFTYNADSTQYYLVSRIPDVPYYHFMNVFDMDLNLTEQIRLDSDPPVYLQATHGYWCQNPYNAKIYCLGQVTVPNMMYQDIVAFKIDIDNDKVDFLRLSYSPDEIRNVVVLDKNLCFFPDGKIFGCAVYDVELFNQYKPGAYIAYIPVFDINMKKESEWYYSIGYEYNQFMYQIDRTKDNGIILMGYERFKIDEEILWEPYIVKFPASAFDPDNIEEAHAHGLHLAVAYPNPGGDVLNIRTGLRNATLQVYDMRGRKIHQQEITDEVTSIDASKWTNGTYIWELGTGNGSRILESGKWVKD